MKKEVKLVVKSVKHSVQKTILLGKIVGRIPRVFEC